MVNTELFDKHVEEYEQWYEDYTEVYESELLAVREQLRKLPENIRGIEVGLGTGRFSKPLGIKEGIEPSAAMARIAMKRGIEIMPGVAERLPYGDIQFDFVLFVTICHLNDFKGSLAEAYRVLKKGGSIIIGFLDKKQAIAKEYLAKRKYSTFFRHATFYSVGRMEKLLKSSGFKDLEFNQTLFGALNDIDEIQRAKSGTGEGSFVVVKAIKN